MSTDIREQISIVVPVFNEELAIEQVLGDILQNYGTSEIIVVDDGSSDTTKEKIGKFNVRVICHENNKGYGAALKTGIRNATKEIIVTIDADGEHSARDIEPLILAFDSFDMSVGKRTASTEKKLWKKMGKYILHKTANLASGVNIPDINSGLRVFRKEAIINYLGILPDTFSFHTTSTLVFIFNNYKIKYIPVKVLPRKGNSKVSVQSGINSLKKILIISLMFKPLRAILLLLYPLLISIFFILSIYSFILRENNLVPLFILVFLIFLLIIMDILSKNRKDLISDIN